MQFLNKMATKLKLNLKVSSMKRQKGDKQLARYITRKERYSITLNGKEIDEGYPISLGVKVFGNLIGKNHFNSQSAHYFGGFMNRSEFKAYHENRLGVQLAGVLEMIDTNTNTKLMECNI
jgi:hypothetical protein